MYLDTIGLPPTPKRSPFIATPERISAASDRLIAETAGICRFWTVKFEDWFRNNQLNSQGRSMGKFKEWLSELVAADRPYDQMVRELITSEGDTFQQPATNFWHPATDFMLKKFDVKKATPTVSRLFLGIRMECAECHNHPLENFTQDDFYGFSAFFAGFGEAWHCGISPDLVSRRRRRSRTSGHEKSLWPPKFLGAKLPRFAPEEDRRVACRLGNVSEKPVFRAGHGEPDLARIF